MNPLFRFQASAAACNLTGEISLTYYNLAATGAFAQPGSQLVSIGRQDRLSLSYHHEPAERLSFEVYLFSPLAEAATIGYTAPKEIIQGHNYGVAAFTSTIPISHGCIRFYLRNDGEHSKFCAFESRATKAAAASGKSFCQGGM